MSRSTILRASVTTTIIAAGLSGCITRATQPPTDPIFLESYDAILDHTLAARESAAQCQSIAQTCEAAQTYCTAAETAADEAASYVVIAARTPWDASVFRGLAENARGEAQRNTVLAAQACGLDTPTEFAGLPLETPFDQWVEIPTASNTFWDWSSP